jgi:hypothetical protein
MSVERTGSSAGRTRVCPHCKSVILESASICPACHHHLRFGPQTTDRRHAQRYSAFHVEGTFRQPAEQPGCEYTVVISVRNGQGNEIKRHVIDVGAMTRDDLRTFDLSVEVSVPNR